MPETVGAICFSFRFFLFLPFCLYFIIVNFDLFIRRYCDCFAAGMYCSESCSCQLCFNKPESLHIVLERRHQIESRDPFAFAPRVIEDRNELPVNNVGGTVKFIFII